MTSPLNENLTRSIVLIGLMGAGKTSVGWRLAKKLGLDFVDADEEIVKAAGCSVEDIFDLYGEEAFRDGEQKVIARLLREGPIVLATGGGAFMDARTQARISMRGISVWLKADLETLVERTGRRGGRPLLQEGNPKEILQQLMDERYPVYAEADISVMSGREHPDYTVDRIIEAINENVQTGEPVVDNEQIESAIKKAMEINYDE